MTPDWAAAPTAVPYATFGDPQTLNLYAYVNNNPNTGIDLGGHCGGAKAHLEPGRTVGIIQAALEHVGCPGLATDQVHGWAVCQGACLGAGAGTIPDGGSQPGRQGAGRVMPAADTTGSGALQDAGSDEYFGAATDGKAAPEGGS